MNNSYAQSSNQKQESIRLNHIAIYVYDLKRSADFYDNILQLRQIPEPFKDGLHVWYSIGGNSSLHLIEGAGGVREHNKNTHLCFSVPSVDEFIARLDHHNIEYENWPGTEKAPTLRVDGVKQIYFRDPDGYWIEINDDFRQ
jgi:lactoylglutathione lyase